MGEQSSNHTPKLPPPFHAARTLSRCLLLSSAPDPDRVLAAQWSHWLQPLCCLLLYLLHDTEFTDSLYNGYEYAHTLFYQQC